MNKKLSELTIKDIIRIYLWLNIIGGILAIISYQFVDLL